MAQPNQRKARSALLLMGSSMAVIYTASILLINTRDVVDTVGVAPVNIAIALIIFISFLGGLYVTSQLNLPIQGSGMRTAIAFSFVITYLLLLVTFGFGNYSSVIGRDQTELGATIIGQFGVLTGTIVVGYFGVSAYSERAERRGRGPESSSTDDQT